MSINKKSAKSPLEDIKGIKTSVTMQDILNAIKDGREGRYWSINTDGESGA
jgi:hypothetical protein